MYNAYLGSLGVSCRSLLAPSGSLTAPWWAAPSLRSHPDSAATATPPWTRSGTRGFSRTEAHWEFSLAPGRGFGQQSCVAWGNRGRVPCSVEWRSTGCTRSSPVEKESNESHQHILQISSAESRSLGAAAACSFYCRYIDPRRYSAPWLWLDVPDSCHSGWSVVPVSCCKRLRP